MTTSRAKVQKKTVSSLSGVRNELEHSTNYNLQITIYDTKRKKKKNKNKNDNMK